MVGTVFLGTGNPSLTRQVLDSPGRDGGGGLLASLPPFCATQEGKHGGVGTAECFRRVHKEHWWFVNCPGLQTPVLGPEKKKQKEKNDTADHKDTAGFARAGQGWGQAKGTFRKCFPSPAPGTEGKFNFSSSNNRRIPNTTFFSNYLESAG